MAHSSLTDVQSVRDFFSFCDSKSLRESRTSQAKSEKGGPREQSAASYLQLIFHRGCCSLLKSLEFALMFLHSSNYAIYTADRREFMKISQAVGMGFLIMGAIGYIIKLSECICAVCTSSRLELEPRQKSQILIQHKPQYIYPSTTS